MSSVERWQSFSKTLNPRNFAPRRARADLTADLECCRRPLTLAVVTTFDTLWMKFQPSQGFIKPLTNKLDHFLHTEKWYSMILCRRWFAIPRANFGGGNSSKHVKTCWNFSMSCHPPMPISWFAVPMLISWIATSMSCHFDELPLRWVATPPSNVCG